MKLYGLPPSPFVQRVLIAARIKGHELALEPPPGGLMSPEFRAMSPMARIPVLEEEDGWRVAESAAIIDYLDHVLAGPPLLPADPRARARARQVSGLVDTELGAGLRHFATQKMFCVCDSPDQLDYGRAQLSQGLNALEKIGIGDHGWAVSGAPGIADAALIPILAFADLMTDHFDGGPLIAGVPKVESYWTRAKVDPLAAQAVKIMGGIVPIIMGRRQAAVAQA